MSSSGGGGGIGGFRQSRWHCGSATFTGWRWWRRSNVKVVESLSCAAASRLFIIIVVAVVLIVISAVVVHAISGDVKSCWPGLSDALPPPPTRVGSSFCTTAWVPVRVGLLVSSSLSRRESSRVRLIAASLTRSTLVINIESNQRDRSYSIAVHFCAFLVRQKRNSS